MALVLGIVGFALLAGIAPAWWLGRRYRERWGTRRVEHGPRGSGPYRQASVSERKPRGVPWVAAAAAALGTSWGILTLIVMVPSGLFLLFAVGQRASTVAFGIPGALGLILSGIALCPVLCAAGVVLLRVDGNVPHLRRLTIWTGLHHAGALALTGVLALIERELWPLVVIAAPPSAIGLIHALLLWCAVDCMGQAARSRGVEQRRGVAHGGSAGPIASCPGRAVRRTMAP